MIAAQIKGEKFGRLTVIEYKESIKGQRCWICLCECGNETVVRVADLRSGNTTSCGCLHNENTANINKTHNASRTPEYESWCNMKRRCYDPTNEKYPIYGARGITVCKRWLNSFENFLADMGKKPSKVHSLDRIKVNGNYKPSNCRWATPKEQSRNLRTNRWFEYKGERKILADWAKYFKKSHSTIIVHLKTKSFEDVARMYEAKANKVA